MSLHTNRWHMAYFLCNFQGFPLLWAASAKLLKKLQFPSFQRFFFCCFLVFPVLWGAPSGTTAEKVAISMISHCRKASFLPVVPHKPVAEVSKSGKPIGEVGCCESGMAERSH